MIASPSPSALFSRDVPHDVREQLFGGRGRVRVWALVAAPASPFTAVLACELEPGGSVGMHLQEQYPEIVIAVSGRGSVRVNGNVAGFASGSVVELAQGQTLAIDNEASPEPLCYLIIKAETLTNASYPTDNDPLKAGHPATHHCR